MKKPTVDPVKKLAAQLSADDRLQVCQFLADFPDSRISYDQDLPAELFAVPPSVPLALEHKKQALGMLELKTHWDCVIENGQIVYSLEGREVFRAIFNSENYVEVCFEKLRADALYLFAGLALSRCSLLQPLMAVIRSSATSNMKRVPYNEPNCRNATSTAIKRVRCPVHEARG